MMGIRDNKEKFGIDLSADPLILPKGFEVIEHLRGGFLEWNPLLSQIVLHLVPGQGQGTMDGHQVFEKLGSFDGTPVNANMLDYFVNNMAHKPWVIPKEWENVEHHRSKHILFWGTRYRFEGAPCVRSLNWSADAREQVWRPGYCWIDSTLNPQFPAAMLRAPASKDKE
jgi:hypothetical protein